MSLANAYLALSGAIDADLVRGERLAQRSALRVGGPAAMLAVCHTLAALARAIEVLSAQGVAWVLMGKGCGILACDQGFDGCVLVLGREFSRSEICAADATITAGGAVALPNIVTAAMRASLSGLEFACGIPGTLGAAVSMDVGEHHEWIGPRVLSLVTYLPGIGLRRHRGAEVEWGYRWCGLDRSEIVLEATLALEPRPRAAVAADMETRLARRRACQPIGVPCLGPLFRDPNDGRDAAQLLEACGMGGYCIGGAQVCRTHANFVMNDGTARASDVLAVMRIMHDKVKEASGVDLQAHVKFLGFSS